MSDGINIAARGYTFGELSGEFARAHHRLASLPTYRHRPSADKDAQAAEKRIEITEKIQRSRRNRNLAYNAPAVDEFGQKVRRRKK